MIDTLLDSLAHALMITGFVFGMMLVIEYLNVLTQGVWQRGLSGSRWQQYLLAVLLGVTPGCLGAFAVVSLYSHRVVSLGAVVAAMVATSGDEAFVMLSMIPETALWVFLLLLVIGLLAGVLTDLLAGPGRGGCEMEGGGMLYHEQETCNCFPRGMILEQWRHCSLARAVLMLVLSLFALGLGAGRLGPAEWSWLRVTLLLTTSVGLFIVATVPDHFLKEHLWQHVARVHVPKIFLWTFGAILLMHVLLTYLNLGDWIADNPLLLVVLACVVGLVPESGPHLVFLTLYAQGVVPFSVLLASSIVQDGHGMLPLLAESRLDFFRVKGINFIVGVVVGLVGILMGW